VSIFASVSAVTLEEPPITKLISNDSVSRNLSYASVISPLVVAKSSVPPVNVETSTPLTSV